VAEVFVGFAPVLEVVARIFPLVVGAEVCSAGMAMISVRIAEAELVKDEVYATSFESIVVVMRTVDEIVAAIPTTTVATLF
jgi:hypothetical protein